MLRWLASAALAALLAGCGTKPLDPPHPQHVREPGRMTTLRDPRSGIRFQAPVNWVKRIRTNPGIFRIASGAADVSGWAYPRYEKLPRTMAELEAARDALIAEAEKRNSTLQLASSAITRVQGSPAIELHGRQKVLGREIETRSVHVYRKPGEYVFEALAPPSSFKVADQDVLTPLLRTLKFRSL
jgi:hypothetical protein